ncbi:AMP-binding protein [Phaeobacter sp. BS23]|uniref:AMP-binding protein n=1 Tax=Phaeobacter sp. BS23 TaxID=2907239 RepID=UPI00386A9D0B
MKSLVVCADALQYLPDLLPSLPEGAQVIGPEIDSFDDIPAAFPSVSFHTRDMLQTGGNSVPRPSSETLAYLCFTSGSTGKPKGIPISRDNLDTYVKRICDRFNFTPDDRIFQTSPLSFDVSIHNIMAAWCSGATLVALSPAKEPQAFEIAKTENVTSWTSTPSLVSFLDRLGVGASGALPDLRLVVFCGEALPENVAACIANWAPNAKVNNLYGPTEATIAISCHQWRADRDYVDNNGIVPIGEGFESSDLGVFDLETGTEISGEGVGELWLRGAQITSGYWENEAQTRRSFCRDPSGQRWYKTGDQVRRDAQGQIHFLGRLDNQFKLFGYRVELGAIEAVLRELTGLKAVFALPWPYGARPAQGLVAALESPEPVDTLGLKQAMRAHLPKYMVPSQITVVDAVPRNLSGKHDRSALATLIEAQLGRQLERREKS